MHDKKTLRAEYERKRSLFVMDHEKKDWASLQAKLNQNISRVLQELSPGMTLAYQSLRTEPNLSAVTEMQSQRIWAYPKIVGSRIEFYRVTDKDQLEKGPFGILEPIADENRKVKLSDVQAVLIPGVAFDLNGTRLGRGKGHYDRVLSLMPQALRIGVGFSCQLSFKPLPQEDHDQKMHFIVTEELIWCPQWENWVPPQQEMKG